MPFNELQNPQKVPEQGKLLISDILELVVVLKRQVKRPFWLSEKMFLIWELFPRYFKSKIRIFPILPFVYLFYIIFQTFVIQTFLFHYYAAKVADFDILLDLPKMF